MNEGTTAISNQSLGLASPMRWPCVPNAIAPSCHAAGLVLLTVGMASFVPAWRAWRVDPIDALRVE